MNRLDRNRLQLSRRQAHDDHKYELDDWEGFTCTECGHRELTAGASEAADTIVTPVCSACGSPTETGDQETDWTRVKEKIPEPYLTGDDIGTPCPTCPHCGRRISETDELTTWRFQETTAALHAQCLDSIWQSHVADAFWYNAFTPAHYEAAAAHLQSVPCVGEVITNAGRLYGRGEMYVHTNYATTAVVADVLDAFNGQVVSAEVATERRDGGFNCVTKHGDCFEIAIDFSTQNSTILPPTYFDETCDGGSGCGPGISDADRYEPLFNANFACLPDTDLESVPEALTDHA